MLFENVKPLLEQYKRLWALGYAESLMSWDTETYMPESDSSVRGEVIATFSEIIREIYLKIWEELKKYEGKEGLSDEEKGVIRVLHHSAKYYAKVPLEIIQELDKTTSEAVVVWRNAKKKNDFNAFKPYLEKIVELNRNVADFLGYEKNPYDALLDLYEEGFTTDDGDKVFSSLVPQLSDILKKVEEKGYFPREHKLESVEYNVEEMKRVNEEIIKLLRMPQDRFRLDTSAHPFTVRLSTNDVRITTRYEGRDFKETLFSVIHESGHAIYELLIDPALEGTPLASGASTGIHESQSRFWENIIGRSRAFVHVIYPILKSNLPFLDGYDEEEVYRYFNTVKPSLIRVDADEVTYNFHIALRYEIEKKLMNDEIKVNELPQIWNEMMEKYLGITPKNDSEGVLQDIHWSQGSIGYFPTYTLGNIVAGIVYKSFPNLYDLVYEGRFEEVKGFLREKICKYGSIYSPKELLKRSFGKEYEPEGLLDYLREKYLREHL
jgi:carboxypeptidase Taq